MARRGRERAGRGRAPAAHRRPRQAAPGGRRGASGRGCGAGRGGVPAADGESNGMSRRWRGSLADEAQTVPRRSAAGVGGHRLRRGTRGLRIWDRPSDLHPKLNRMGGLLCCPRVQPHAYDAQDAGASGRGAAESHGQVELDCLDRYVFGTRLQGCEKCARLRRVWGGPRFRGGSGAGGHGRLDGGLLELVG